MHKWVNSPYNTEFVSFHFFFFFFFFLMLYYCIDGSETELPNSYREAWHKTRSI